MLRPLVVLLALLSLSSAASVAGNGKYKVLRIHARTWADVDSLQSLRTAADDDVDFWLNCRQPGGVADVMVHPRAQKWVADWLKSRGLHFETTIDDVESLIVSERKLLAPEEPPGSWHDDLRLHDAPPDDASTKFGDRPYETVHRLRGFNYPFGEYASYATMLRYLRTVEFYYPHIAKLIRIGTTHEGRPIEGLRLGYHATNATKRVFWIDGNIHAREWASSHTALFIIHQLVAGYGKDPVITHYMNHVTFLVVPCLNPDGYEYSKTSSLPDVRLWRKNRSPEECVEARWGGIRCCQGVDLNRNFDFHWAETGSSENPCSNLFAGVSAFSEPESRAVADFLAQPEFRGRIDGFITLHTYAQLWIHPYSHEVQYFPNDIARLSSVAREAVARIRDVYGTQFRVGTGADLLSPASGGSDDWAKESLNAKYVYLLELRPQLEFSRGFILRREELIPTAIESFEGIKTVVDAVLADVGIKFMPPKPKVESEVRVHAIATFNADENEEKLTVGRFSNQDRVNERLIDMSVLQPRPSPVRVEMLDAVPPTPPTAPWTAAPIITSPATTTTTTTTASTTTTTPTPTTTTYTTTRPTTTTTTAPTTTTTSTTTTTTTTTPRTTTTTTPTTTTTTPTTTTTTTPAPTTTTTTTPTTTTTTSTTTTTTRPTTTTTTTTTVPTITTTRPTTTTTVPTTTTTRPTTTSTTSKPSTTTTRSTPASTTKRAPSTTTTTPRPSTTSTSSASPTTTSQSSSKRLNQELLRKQRLRLETLRRLKESIRQRLAARTSTAAPTTFSTPKPTISTTDPASPKPPLSPKGLAMAPLRPTTSARPPTTTALKLAPLIAPEPTVASVCDDKKYSCPFWIRTDRTACTVQRAYMEQNCARSCHFCSS